MTYTCAGGSPASLEGVTFPGGRFVATTDDAGTTTMTPMLYASDHLGSVRSVVNGLTGETVETNDYYPFGGKWNDGSSSDPTNRYRYNGKEEQALFSTPYSDYGARQYSSASARWLTLDPLANKYYGTSPYAFCANNPINFVDPDGKDWYLYKNNILSDNGEVITILEYIWTSVTSQGELNKLGVDGVYLGEAVVLFNGFYDEKLNTDGTLSGSEAKAADVTIYGINGPNDISTYLGLSTTSDPSKYSMIQDGEYRVFHQQMSTSIYGKESLTYRISELTGNLLITPYGGKNKHTGKAYMEAIFLHRTNKNGCAKNASAGCLVIDGRQWDKVEEQLGNSNKIYLRLTRQ